MTKYAIPIITQLNSSLLTKGSRMAKRNTVHKTPNNTKLILSHVL